VKFSDLFASATSRHEVVCTFLALLELVRLRQIACAQSAAFGEIEIVRAPEPVAPPSEPPPPAEPVPAPGPTDS